MTMAEGTSRQLWDEMIETYVGDGQQYARDGNQRAAAAKFETAFEVLVRSYQQDVVRFCGGMLQKPRAEVEDLAQEILIAAWKALPRFEFRASIHTWLLAIARHHCWDAMRPPGHVDVPLDGDDGEATREFPDPTPLPEALIIAKELTDWVREGLAKLGPADREVLVISYYTDLPPDQIPEVLGISMDNVRQRRRRALQCLRRIITDGIHGTGER
jgi:RNA polymerase sigma-70 factor, ECF subfamily